MTKNNNKAKSIIFLRLMLIMSGFLIAACSKVDAEDTNKETIKKVLEHQFTGPDEQFVELFNKDDFKELGKYYKEAYGSYFIESAFDSFISALAGQYPTLATHNGYKLSLKNITIEQSEKNSYLYNFIAKVGCQKNGVEEKNASVEGIVLFSEKEKGKIEGFRYMNDNGLSEILRTSN